MSTETPKQRLRRLLDRLDKLPPEQLRELDRLIEEASDEEAETALAGLDELESKNPGTIEDLIRELNENGFPDE